MTPFQRRLLALLLALGLLAMLGAALHKRLTEPSLVTRAAPRTMAAMDAAVPQAESELARLMRQAGEDPANPALLKRLSQELLDRGSFVQAESFLERAETLDASDPDIPYLRGYALHKSGDHAGAAKAMERSLALADRARVRISLGSLLRYYLDDPAQARVHFERGLSSPDCSPGERDMLEKELAKLSN